jgi:hypothetical protein
MKNCLLTHTKEKRNKRKYINISGGKMNSHRFRDHTQHSSLDQQDEEE